MDKVAWVFGFVLAAAAVSAVAGAVALLPAGQPVPPAVGAMQSFEPKRPPVPAPAIVFGDAEGRPLDLDAFAGEVRLVNLWATWCAPCIRELPALARLEDALAGEGFRLLAISIDRGGPETVAPFLDRLGLDGFVSYYDPGSRVPSAFGAIGLPTTVLIDRQGRWAGTLAGAAEWDGAEAKALMRFYLER